MDNVANVACECRKSCNKDSDEEYFFEVDAQYLEKLHDFHNDLPFLPGKMKIEKVQRLIAKLQNKSKFVILTSKETA